MPMLLTALIMAQAAMPLGHAEHETATPEPVCVRAGDLPRNFAKWNSVPSSVLRVGVPVEVTALPESPVKWAAPPGKPGRGAVRGFSIARAGVYQLGLSNGAWIDVVRRGKALKSVAHGHGPLCTGLRKIVDFRLARGTYRLQLAAMPEATTKVMVVLR
ncbi:hypothetical protein [Sphingomonas sp. PB4P5]|uniref:hypothetical protein n=1 Tax=Parasphingomonas puruogangriensis TaxID=3096155 RepID=UPI002FCB57A7